MPRVLHKCAECNKDILVWPYEIVNGHRKFCSRQCTSQWRSRTWQGSKNPKWNNVTLSCETCGKPITIPVSRLRAKHHYCSQECHYALKHLSRTCLQCGIDFQAELNLVNRGGGKFCSRACRGKWMSIHKRGEHNHNWTGGKEPCQCEQCGTIFFAYKGNQNRFCGFPCYSKWRAMNLIGDRCYAWKGGLSKEEYPMEWVNHIREEIRERDERRCKLCGLPENGTKHSVHHIDYDKANLDPRNLVTLCKYCHPKTNGKVNNRIYWQTQLSAMVQEVAVSA